MPYRSDLALQKRVEDDTKRRDAPASMTVTIIVATYNRSEMLAEAVDSLLAQSRPADEIIVIDDGSTDDTAARMASYAGRISYVRNLANLGRPASLNWVIPRAQGTHIWLFDDDDVALPDALANHIAYLAAHPEIDFSYSDKYTFAGNTGIWQRRRWSIDRLPPIPPEAFVARTLFSMNTMLPGMLIPARCYRAAGLFDATLDRCQDHELLIRLARLFRAGNMGQPSFVYRLHGGTRGSQGLSHGAAERYRVQLAYRQTLFRRLRDNAPVALFALAASDQATLATPAETAARLRRGCVMLRHGLIDEGLDDLRVTLADVLACDHASDALASMLSAATQCEAWTWPHARADLARLAGILAATGTLGLARYLARGLYWQSRGDLQGGRYRQSALSISRMVFFLAQVQARRLTRRAS